MFFLLFSSAYAQNDSCNNIKDLDKSQIRVLQYAYHYGKKHNLGYTMAAIAWKESCAGLYRINFDDPSAGIYHAHLPGVIKRYYQAKDTPFKRNVVAEKLIRDPEFASQIALEELLYWQKTRNGNQKAMLKSYNKGFSWEKDKAKDELAQAYYHDIKKRIKILQAYFQQNPAMQFPPKSPKKSSSQIAKTSKSPTRAKTLQKSSKTPNVKITKTLESPKILLLKE